MMTVSGFETALQGGLSCAVNFIMHAHAHVPEQHNAQASPTGGHQVDGRNAVVPKPDHNLDTTDSGTRACQCRGSYKGMD